MVNLFAPLPSFLDGIVSYYAWKGAVVKRIHELGGSVSMEEFGCNREYTLKGVSSRQEICGYHGYDIGKSILGFFGFWGKYSVEAHLLKTHRGDVFVSGAFISTWKTICLCLCLGCRRRFVVRLQDKGYTSVDSRKLVYYVLFWVY